MWEIIHFGLILQPPSQEFGGVAEGERICERTRIVFSGLFG